MKYDVLDLIKQEIDDIGTVECPNCEAPIHYEKPVKSFRCDSCDLSWNECSICGDDEGKFKTPMGLMCIVCFDKFEDGGR